MSAETESGVALTREQWSALRHRWDDEVAVGRGTPVGPDEDPGPALEAAECDGWTIIAVSPEGDVLGEEMGSFYLIRDDEDPWGVDVTGEVRGLLGLPPGVPH